MPNTLFLTGHGLNTTKALEFKHPITGVWTLGTLNTFTSKYEATFTGVTAGTYGPALKCRLVGTTTEYAFAGAAVNVLDAANPNEVPIVLIYGQSNAHGVGFVAEIPGTALAAVTPSLSREYQRVSMIGYSGAAPKLQLGLTNDGENADYFGAEIGLAQRWEEVNPDGELEILKVTQDGQPIEVFQKGQGNYTTLLNKLNDAKARITAAGKTPVVRGMLWWQGEANTNDAGYAAKLQTLFDDLIADGILPASAKQAIIELKGNAVVQQQQAQYVAANSGRAVLIPTANYQFNPDKLHLNARTQFLAGYTDIFNILFGGNAPYPFPMIPNPAETPVIVSLSTNSAAVGDPVTAMTLFATDAVALFPGVSSPVTPTTITFQGGQTFAVPAGATSGQLAIRANGLTSNTVPFTVPGTVTQVPSGAATWPAGPDTATTNGRTQIYRLMGTGNNFGRGSTPADQVISIDQAVAGEQARVTYPGRTNSNIVGLTLPSGAHVSFAPDMVFGTFHATTTQEQLIRDGQLGAMVAATGGDGTQSATFVIYRDKVDLCFGGAATPVNTWNVQVPAQLVPYWCPNTEGDAIQDVVVQGLSISNLTTAPPAGDTPATFYEVGTAWEEDDSKWLFPAGVWTTLGPGSANYSGGQSYYKAPGATGTAVLANPVHGSALKVYENNKLEGTAIRYEYRPWNAAGTGTWSALGEALANAGGAPTTLPFPSLGYYEVRVKEASNASFYTVLDRTEVI